MFGRPKSLKKVTKAKEFRVDELMLWLGRGSREAEMWRCPDVLPSDLHCLAEVGEHWANQDPRIRNVPGCMDGGTSTVAARTSTSSLQSSSRMA